MNQEEVLLYGVGDLSFAQANPEFILSQVAPTLKKGDITYGHLETSFSDRGARQRVTPFTGGGAKPSDPPRNVVGLTYAGINVVSYAGNHTLDCGEEPVTDTIDILKKNGIAMCGVGKNIDEARKPAIIERKGTKVAFLDYCSVLPKGYEATKDKIGAAPMRVSTFYEEVDGQPGMPPRVVTIPNKEDLEAMKKDIKKVRPLVDVVIMAIHWGLHMIPARLALYEREVAHAAIDAGVDLIFGGHPHVLKGIEVYKGKAIFYSMSNFAFIDSRQYPPGYKKIYPIKEMLSFVVDPDYPTYTWPPDSRKTLIAKCIISNKKITKVSFLPCMVNKQAQPEILSHSDKRSSEVAEYIDWCCKDQDFNTRFSWEGDEVVISI
jgi:poly-gamma-glutamate capsule biosynthesis protein CapA/YwtB (metallophosphatase superfamily)